MGVDGRIRSVVGQSGIKQRQVRLGYITVGRLAMTYYWALNKKNKGNTNESRGNENTKTDVWCD